jgi:hypothetical protein
MKRGWLERATRSPFDFLRVLNESAYRPHMHDERRTPELFGDEENESGRPAGLTQGGATADPSRAIARVKTRQKRA